MFNFLLELKIRIFTVSLITANAPLVTRIGGARKECDAKKNIIIADVNEAKLLPGGDNRYNSILEKDNVGVCRSRRGERLLIPYLSILMTL